jgi:hypothetical protein
VGRFVVDGLRSWRQRLGIQDRAEFGEVLEGPAEHIIAASEEALVALVVQAKKALVRFPSIGEPGAEKILLWSSSWTLVHDG